MKEIISRFSQYMEYKGLNDNQVTTQCNLGVGVIGGAKKGKSDLGKKTINAILEKYQDLNRVWLLTGEGDMLNNPPQQREEEQRPIYEIASSHLARRCFVGNLYKKVKDPNLIGKLSGHKEGSRAFSRYRDIDEDTRRETVDLLES